MKSFRYSIAVIFFCVFTTVTNSVQAQQSPVMDYTSVLNTLDVNHEGGRLILDMKNELIAAFLPEGAKVDAVITKAGSDTPLQTINFYINKLYGVFWNVYTGGNSGRFDFKEAGDYVVTYRANGKPMTQVKFSIDIKIGGDEFDPKKFFYMNGQRNEWAQMRMPLNNDKPDEATPQIVVWLRKVDFVQGRNAQEYFIEVRKDGDVIADCGQFFVSTQEWARYGNDLRFPEDKGGSRMKTRELLGSDGTYDIIITVNKKLHAVYQFVVKEGKPVFHPRQDSSHEPRTDFMITRSAGDKSQHQEISPADVVWMKRLEDTNATSVYEGNVAEVIGPTEADLKRWQWKPSIDPKRGFNLVVTNIETRIDTSIQAGDDIIVFGTASQKGVHYIKVGDTELRTIPEGETYSSEVFRVCGKKIVLVKGKGLVLFDTATEKLTPIPQDEIFLYDVRGGNHQANLLNSDGNLVVAVNNVVKVKDKTVVKVIDVSGDQPNIIPIKNAGYKDSDVSSVAVDAKQGIVAVSSWQQKSLYSAKVAHLANQKAFKLDEYKGVYRNQIYIADDSILYCDNNNKVRLLKLESSEPIALVDESIGRSGNGFIYRNGRLVISTAKKYGTRFHMAVSDLPEKPMTLPGTGTKIERTSGGLGMAGCAAIAADKTVFLAGTPSGGIGVGEHLQILDSNNDKWFPVYNSDGKVITAIDVITSIGLVAFKSADHDRKTTVAYATYGEHIDLGQVPVNATSATKEETDDDTGKTDGTKEDEGNPSYTKDLLELEFIKSYVTTEKELIEAFTSVFGAEEGKKKARKSILKAMKDAKREHLIPGYLEIVKEGDNN